MQRTNLNLYINIVQTNGSEQQLSGSDLPLVIGSGKDSHLKLSSGPAVAGIISQEQGHLFIQPADDLQKSPLFQNDIRLTASSWLKSGDSIQCGNTHITCSISGDKVEFTLSTVARSHGDTPPARAISGTSSKSYVNGYDIPVNISHATGMSRTKKITAAVLGCLLLLLTISLLFILQAEPVELALTPEPDSVSLSGFPPAVKFSSSYLCLPGTYAVQAEKQGYKPLHAFVTVQKDSRNRIEGKLEKLPGKLILDIDPEDHVNVFANNILIGTTPPDTFDLAAGAYTLRLEQKGFKPYLSEITIAGPDRPTVVSARLKQDSAEIGFKSNPPGAAVAIDGTAAGYTPITLRLSSGRKEIVITRDHYQSQQKTIDVEAGVSQSLFFELQLRQGQLIIDSIPSRAAVLVDDNYHGATPISLSLSPDTTHELALFSEGYKPLVKDIRLAPGEKTALTEHLVPERGTVYLITHPPDASVSVDGSPLPSGPGKQLLPTTNLTLEVNAEGYKTEKRTIHPNVGYSQQITVDLSPLKKSGNSAYRNEVQDGPQTTAAGQKLLPVHPASFTMGAPRREPGRRANEAEREIIMKRPFYLSEKPVTNKEYRLFKANHSSGTYRNLSLDGDDQPVVDVSWEDAAAYMNWLSKKDNLQPFYMADGGTFTAVSPPSNGYRLPTEAEWAFAARILKQQAKTRFPWGNEYPPPEKIGNFADESARGIVARIIPGFNDGFPVSGPTGSFPPNKGGFYGMGGNVSEWCHDYYSALPSPSNQHSDPLGPTSGLHHVVRGSSWSDGSVKELRLSYRAYQKSPKNTISFRVARYQ